MAYASDRLKERRMKMMNKGMDMGMSHSMDNDMSEGMMHRPSDRSIQLTQEEMKFLSGTYQPGEEAQCLVTGRIDDNGKLDVISVQPSQPMQKEQSPIMNMNPAVSPS